MFAVVAPSPNKEATLSFSDSIKPQEEPVLAADGEIGPLLANTMNNPGFEDRASDGVPNQYSFYGSYICRDCLSNFCAALLYSHHANRLPGREKIAGCSGCARKAASRRTARRLPFMANLVFGFQLLPQSLVWRLVYPGIGSRYIIAHLLASLLAIEIKRGK